MGRSPLWSFVTHDTTPRWIRVPGTTNVRDVGGWPVPGGRRVRQGVIYRGSEMNRHIEIADEGRRVLEDELGIRTDLDLRSSKEDGVVLDSRKVQWINVPIRPYGDILCDDERDTQGFRDVFGVLATAENYPIYFHCWGGADRGGTVAFLLGALLGQSMESLIRDYELTSLSIWGGRTRQSEEFQSLLAALGQFGHNGDGIGGRVENYLLSTGVTEASIQALRRQLIVDG